MNPRKLTPTRDDDVEVPPHPQHWLLRILENQGFATLFGVVVLIGGWRVAEAHIDFLRQQITQMQLQTNILSEIATSNRQQELQLKHLQEEIRNHAGM